MLSRYLSPVVEIVCCPVSVLSQPNCSDRVLSRYLSPVVEIECVVSLCLPSSSDRVLSRYLSPVVEIVCCLVMSAQ